jgi:hypothetical protein
VTIGELMCITGPRTPAPVKSVVARAGKLVAMVFTGHGTVTAAARGSRVKCSAMRSGIGCCRAPKFLHNLQVLERVHGAQSGRRSPTRCLLTMAA